MEGGPDSDSSPGRPCPSAPSVGLLRLLARPPWPAPHPCPGTRGSQHKALPGADGGPQTLCQVPLPFTWKWGRWPDRCPSSRPGWAERTRGHVHTRRLDKQLLASATSSQGLGPSEPCPPSTHKAHICFLPSPLLLRPQGWDTLWAGLSSGLVSGTSILKRHPDPEVKGGAGHCCGPRRTPAAPARHAAPSAPSRGLGQQRRGWSPRCSLLHSFIPSFNKHCGDSPVRRG